MIITINSIEEAVLKMSIEDIDRQQHVLSDSIAKSRDILKSIAESRNIDPDRIKLISDNDGSIHIVVEDNNGG